MVHTVLLDDKSRSALGMLLKEDQACPATSFPRISENSAQCGLCNERPIIWLLPR
jgi:hypothetical protein